MRRAARPSDQAVLAGHQIFFDHQRHLENDRVVKLAQIETCELLDLLQPVDQRVAVDEQLPGRLRDVQVVFKEFVDGEQRLLIEGWNSS